MNTFKSLFTVLLMATASQAALAHNDSHTDIVPTPATVAAIGERPTYLGSASVALLERDIPLFPGYGEAHFFQGLMSTSDKYVNQGFSALNVFHYADAFRSFRMAANEDADSIFAQVGIVFSSLELDPTRSGIYFATQAFQQMQIITGKRRLTAKETAWSDIAKAFYVARTGTASGIGTTAPSFSEAHRNLMATDGQNPEALGYINWSILNNANLEYIKQGLAQVLLRYPNHAGAHHYLLHIGEFENDMTSAVFHAEILITLSPDSAHAQHMYGHVLPQSGQWQKALDMFLIADEIHQKWATQNQAALEEDWHYAHNLDLMAAAYLGLGNSPKALETWTAAMPYDQRAIPKAIGLSMAMGELDYARQILEAYEAMGPGWANYLKSLRTEYELLSNPAVIPAISARVGSYDYLVKLTVELAANPLSEAQLINNARQYFISRLKAGGFDGWSNGFVELLRLKAVARTFNATTLEQEIQAIETAARAGTL